MTRSISPLSSFAGTFEVPGDKSVTHRALILGALTPGETRVLKPARGADPDATRQCLTALGVSITPISEGWLVQGVGREGLSPPDGPLDCANSGTTMRLLTGLLAGLPFESTLIGDASLSRRPMERIATPLRNMGAEIETTDGHAPIRIRGRTLRGTALTPSVASAQVESSILLAGLSAEGETVCTLPGPARDHTDRMLRAAGVEARRTGLTVRLQGPCTPGPLPEIQVPGDISQAAYPLACALLLGDELRIPDLGLNPTRTGILDALERMGAEVRVTDRRTAAGGEPIGTLILEATEGLQGTAIEGEAIGRLIDELPLLAVLAAGARGETRVRDAAELRVKETDRIAATTRGLRAIGVDVEEFEDGWHIRGPAEFRPGTVDSEGDHRIAMSFAVAGYAGAGIELQRSEAVDVSWPDFYERMEKQAWADSAT